MLNIGEHVVTTIRKTEYCEKCRTITDHDRFIFSEVNKDIIIDNCLRCNFYIKI